MVATKAKKVSTTNMVEKIPHDKKVSAPVTAAIGHAFAAVLIRDIEDRAEAEVKIQLSLKDRLRQLVAFPSHEDHVGFRADCSQRQDQISNAAKSISISVAEYRTRNPAANTIYTQLSEWKNLSEAAEASWVPNYDLSWNVLKAQATDWKNSTGKTPPELLQQRKAVLLDEKMPDEKKIELVASLDSKIAETKPAQAAPSARTGRKPKANVDKAMEMLEQFPISDLEIVYQRLGVLIQNRASKLSTTKPGEAERGVKATPSGRGMAPSVEKEEKPTVQKEEPATAKGSRRGRKASAR